MPKIPLIAIVAFTLLLTPQLVGEVDGPAFEYRVMSLVEMFAGTPAASKIPDIAVQVNGATRRTDMDAADYQEALNRLAAQGWELVTVNKSNYWVFRRLGKEGAK